MMLMQREKSTNMSQQLAKDSNLAECARKCQKTGGILRLGCLTEGA